MKDFFKKSMNCEKYLAAWEIAGQSPFLSPEERQTERDYLDTIVAGVENTPWKQLVDMIAQAKRSVPGGEKVVVKRAKIASKLERAGNG